MFRPTIGTAMGVVSGARLCEVYGKLGRWGGEAAGESSVSITEGMRKGGGGFITLLKSVVYSLGLGEGGWVFS